MRVRTMIRAMLVVAATAMILVALTACGGGSAQEQAKPRVLPEDEKALQPGEYRSEEYEPSLSFRVGKGWEHAEEAPYDLHMGRKERPLGWLGFFTNVQQVFKPSKPGQWVEAPKDMLIGVPGQWVEAPKDMVGWYQHHPYLQATKPEPISVGGVKGVQFDVVVDLPKDYIEAVEPNCVELFKPVSNQGAFGDGVGLCSETDPSESGGYGGEKQRTIVLEGVKGETVTIIYPRPVPEFDEMPPEAQRIIDSVKWRDS